MYFLYKKYKYYKKNKKIQKKDTNKKWNEFLIFEDVLHNYKPLILNLLYYNI